MNRRKAKENAFNAKYPPNGELERLSVKNNCSFHIGYYTRKARGCPVCGHWPVFEESLFDKTPPGQRARVFIGYCPQCEIRTARPARIRDAVNQWQRQEYSHDSLIVSKPIRHMDTYGARLLCKTVVEDMIDDVLVDLRERNNKDIGSEAWMAAGYRLETAENYFRTSPLMYDLDADGLISDIRKALYPRLPPEERTKIPLKLTKLYLVKEIERKWIEKNSLQQQSEEVMPRKRPHRRSSGTTQRMYIRKKTTKR